MALYDDAKLIFLASAAAGQERKDSSKVYNVKPAPIASSTNAQDLSTFTITNVSNAANSISVSGGVATFAGDGTEFTHLDKASVFEANKKYKVVATVEITSGAIKFQDGITDAKIGVATVSGKYAFYFTSASSGAFSRLRIARKDGSAAFNFTVSDVSVSEVDVLPADFDISRDANLDATRVGPAGLIEKGRENLILQSNAFTTTWSTSNSPNITSGQLGYDGSLNAWKIELTANFGQILQTSLSVPTISTLSIFVKAGTAGFVRLRIDADTNAIADFDLSDGSVAHTEGNIIATKADSFGDGWFRVQMTSTTASGSVVRIYPAVAANDLSGTSGFIYVQDSQLEVGLVATDVITTGAAAATAGIKEDEPRFDYPLAGGAPALLIEPERQNLITVSEYFGGSGWDDNGSGVTVVTNHAVSPEGVKNAAKLIIDNAVSSGAEFRTASAVSVTSGKVYAFSIFAKADGFDQVQLDVFDSKFGGTNTHATLSGDGSITSSGADTTASSIENYGNGWYRIILIGTCISSGTSDFILRLQVNGINGTGDGSKGILIYGAQAEEGPSANSYIPCHEASATRTTDDVAALDTSGFSFGTTCTIFFEGSIGQFNPTASSTIPITMFASHASPNNSERYVLFASTFSSGTYTLTSRHDHNGNTVGVSKSGLTEGAKVKVAAVFNGTSQKFFVNGALAGTNTHVAASLFESLDLSGYAPNKNHTVGSVMLFDSAISDVDAYVLTDTSYESYSEAADSLNYNQHG